MAKHNSNPRSATSRRLKCLAGAWLALTTVGAAVLAIHSSTPGKPIAPDKSWPGGNLIARPEGVFTLVMVLHPNCPCSRASLIELEKLSSQCSGKLSAIVLLDQLPGLRDDSVTKDFRSTVARIPCARCIDDQGGLISAQFGASTSGQVCLYDAEGTLRFSGGITPQRGHAGDNAGVDSILAIVAGKTPTTNHSPVFGCSLR